MSSSRSSSTQSTEFTDNRTVQGEGALYANNGAGVAVTNYVLDNGAIGRAFDANDRATAGAFNFGKDALRLSERGLSEAFNFGGDAVTSALNFGRATTAAALDASDNAFDRALDYSASATRSALDNLQSTQRLVTTAYADAKGRGALTDKILIGAIGAVALVAVFALRSKG